VWIPNVCRHHGKASRHLSAKMGFIWHFWHLPILVADSYFFPCSIFGFWHIRYWVVLFYSFSYSFRRPKVQCLRITCALSCTFLTLR
jgi:hypothetical protein